MNKLVGILCSIGACIVAFVVLNFVNQVGSDWSFMAMAGAVWGGLIGLFVAVLGNKWPVLAGALASTILMALLVSLMSTIPGGIVTSTAAIIGVVVKTIGIGAFCGLGYKLAVRSLAPSVQ